MAEHIKPIDIGDAPDLLRVAEEVRHSNEARLLRRGDEDLALVVPLPARARKRGSSRGKTDADYEAFRSAAGGWKDIDTDKLIEDIYESRRTSTRPPVEL